MRTNIVLDDELIAEAMRLSGAPSKRATVEEALRVFVQVKAAEQERDAYRDRLRRMSTRLSSIRLSDRPSDVLRHDRDRQ